MHKRAMVAAAVAAVAFACAQFAQASVTTILSFCILNAHSTSRRTIGKKEYQDNRHTVVKQNTQIETRLCVICNVYTIFGLGRI